MIFLIEIVCMFMIILKLKLLRWRYRKAGLAITLSAGSRQGPRRSSKQPMVAEKLAKAGLAITRGAGLKPGAPASSRRLNR